MDREFRSWKNQVRLVPVQLGAVADEVLRFLGNDQVDARPLVRIERDVPDTLPPVIAIKDKARQVLVNLCKNALEAMPYSGTLTLRMKAATDSARIEACDTGAGISEGFDVFQPFHSGSLLSCDLAESGALRSSHEGRLVSSGRPVTTVGQPDSFRRDEP